MTTANSVLNRLRLLYPKIGTRLVIPFLLTIAVIAGVSVFVMTRLVAGSIRERLYNQLIDSANAATNALVTDERKQLETLRLMVFSAGIETALENGDAAALDRILRPIAVNARLDEVLVFDAEGSGVYRLRLEAESGAYLNDSPLNVATWAGAGVLVSAGRDALGDKFTDIQVINEQPVVFFSAPVRRREGNQQIGGISIGITAQRLVRRASDQAVSAVALYLADGTLLSHTFRSTPTELLILSPDQTQNYISTIRDYSPVQSFTVEDSPYELLYTPFRLRSTTIGLVGVGLPSNFVVERGIESRNLLSLTFFVLFVIVAGIGLTIAGTIIEPIQRLVATTRAIRAGDLSRRVDLETPDELGELAVSFDKMTDTLVDQNQKIQTLYTQQLEITAQREAILASIADGVIVQDEYNDVLLTNPAAEMMIDHIADHPDLVQQYQAMINSLNISSEAQRIDFLERSYSVIATPVTMPVGESQGRVVVFRDFTAIVQAERLKDELILQMSHELRTPLTVARGYIDILNMMEQARLSEQGKSFVSHAMESLSTLERAVNEVIDVSSILANQMSMGQSKLNLIEILMERADYWKPLMQKRALTFKVALPTNQVWVEGDRERLSQAFDHVLRNAYSYTLPGGQVYLTISAKNHHIVVRIVDSGVGIGEDELPRIFERMYRGRAADAGPTDSRGMGLGLHLTKYFIEAHHGSISLQSQENVGTTVRITLPVAHPPSTWSTHGKSNAINMQPENA